MKSLTLIVVTAAATALAAPAGAQRRVPSGFLSSRVARVAARTSPALVPASLAPGVHHAPRSTRSIGVPRGIGAPFWLDPDTCVIPRVERYAAASTAAVKPDEAIVRVR